MAVIDVVGIVEVDDAVPAGVDAEEDGQRCGLLGAVLRAVGVLFFVLPAPNEEDEEDKE